jgi:hypothetical protein
MMLSRVWKSERPQFRPKTAPSRDVTALKNEFTTSVERRDHERTFQLATTLEAMEANDPRWPRKCGDLLRMAGRPHDAAAAFRRAAKCYEQQGFHDRSRAMTVLARSLGEQSAQVSPEHDSIKVERARS